jgi:hypothetical protein
MDSPLTGVALEDRVAVSVAMPLYVPEPDTDVREVDWVAGASVPECS